MVRLPACGAIGAANFPSYLGPMESRLVHATYGLEMIQGKA
jgi:hypothetical protein